MLLRTNEVKLNSIILKSSHFSLFLATFLKRPTLTMGGRQDWTSGNEGINDFLVKSVLTVTPSGQQSICHEALIAPPNFTKLVSSYSNGRG